nr:MAG TPA: hypothetical protein [Caudoviricetes sp.]
MTGLLRLYAHSSSRAYLSSSRSGSEYSSRRGSWWAWWSCLFLGSD